MLRVVFMGTPLFSVPALNALHETHSVVAVYTQPDRPLGRGLDVKPSPVKTQALELGISVFQPTHLSLPGEFERLQSLKADVIVVAAYGQILKKNVLNLPRLGCINIHSSLLPRWRGAAPIHWAVLEGDHETGITTMHLVEKLDAGNVLLQSKTPISLEDTSETIQDRLAQIGSEIILLTLAGLSSGTLQEVVQDETAVTYAKKLEKRMEWLNPYETAEKLDRQVRALNPWPGTSVGIQGHRLKIKRVNVMKEIQGPIGQIFEKVGMLLLGTSQGCLELKVLQWDGKKEVDAQSFLNGLRGKGIKLPLATDSIVPS